MITDSVRQLRFRPDGTFTIAHFADIHWRNGGERDQQTTALMAAILDAEAPDLVVLDGDVIDGGYCDDPVNSWHQVVTPIVERELPWSAVFGNHDDEGALGRAELMQVQQELPFCLSEPGPEEISGVGNYVLPILSKEGGAADNPAGVLYLLDSHSYAETSMQGYDWIKRDQIEWYLTQAAHLRAQNQGEPLPALAFLHIPLPEYNQVWDFNICYGEKHEPVCCPLINSGFFAALHEAGDVMGTFVGHDHINDFVGELYGIHLCFGRATGYSGYGKEGFKRGARLIRLEEGVREFATWLRLEGDEVVTMQPQHEPEIDRATCIL